jgi:hypothetical protein
MIGRIGLAGLTGLTGLIGLIGWICFCQVNLPAVHSFGGIRFAIPPYAAGAMEQTRNVGAGHARDLL